MSGIAMLGIAAAIAVVIVLIVVIVNRKPAVEEAPPPPPPVTHKVTLYNNGEIVKTIRATYAYASESGGYACADGDQQNTMFGGCFVIEPIDSGATAPRMPESKFKVTLFDGGKVVREWYANYAYASKGGAYLQAAGAEQNTMIGGCFLVEPIV